MSMEPQAVKSKPCSHPRLSFPLIVQKLGGEVAVGEKQEYGRMVIEVVKDYDGLFRDKKVGDKQVVWTIHGDEAVKLPVEVVTSSEEGGIPVVRDRVGEPLYSSLCKSVDLVPDLVHLLSPPILFIDGEPLYSPLCKSVDFVPWELHGGLGEKMNKKEKMLKLTSLTWDQMMWISLFLSSLLRCDIVDGNHTVVGCVSILSMFNPATRWP
ncbi:hypothetical protein L1987_57556 [Smallanthus sonchifolius]|uniref:Uncharacterized protein n=1 Tax=Smallanthus sonchifolius TaxID=185202 RepID=A0ACB9DDG4_9ASTR|nr:hypothetical protein L1987_57556 [Smallanthus sonchifolius]